MHVTRVSSAHTAQVWTGLEASSPFGNDEEEGRKKQGRRMRSDKERRAKGRDGESKHDKAC